jgi:N utilization substance protein A
VNQELLHLVDQISREKGIEKAVLIDAVQSAVLSAARKRYGASEEMKAHLDEHTGELVIVFVKTVVPEEALIDLDTQIGLEDAREMQPGVALGDTVEERHEIGDFGRIAAQAAKQVIIQKVREAERDMVYREFKERQDNLVNGIVGRVEREGNIIVDLGKTEALLPRREQSFRETFRRGDRIRAYIIEVKRSSSGHQVILSRTHPGFLMQLFELEVPEIYEGIVEIKEAVRDPSGRAKIAVMSHDKDVDPVGACVGMKGMRVQAVVQELRGEKIDIIPWIADQEQFVRNALSPAKVSRVHMNEAEKTMLVIVPDDQLSLAIGKRGQNVRLAARLTHWKIDITSESEALSAPDRLSALRQVALAFQPSPSRAADSEAVPVVEVADQPDGPIETASPEASETAEVSQTEEAETPTAPLAERPEDDVKSDAGGDSTGESPDAASAIQISRSDDKPATE